MTPFETDSRFLNLEKGKHLYFASDFHLGAPNNSESIKREKLIVAWLDKIKTTAGGILLLGDIFDFWFEYKNTIPKGFLYFQAKILELCEADIPIYFFTGNHDTWMYDYFPHYFGINVVHKPVTFTVHSKRILVGHGDGLGPGDYFYKFLRTVIFRNSFFQFLFRWIHPDLGIPLAKLWSKESRHQGSKKKNIDFKSKEKEHIWNFAKELENTNHHDFYIFGHRHIPLELIINEQSKYINLGEWLTQHTYLKFDGDIAQLLTFDLSQSAAK